MRVVMCCSITLFLASCGSESQEMETTSKTQTVQANNSVEFDNFKAALDYMVANGQNWDPKERKHHMYKPSYELLLSLGYTQQELWSMGEDAMVELAFIKYFEIVMSNN